MTERIHLYLIIYIALSGCVSADTGIRGESSDRRFCLVGDHFWSISEVAKSWTKGGDRSAPKLAPPTLARARALGIVHPVKDRFIKALCWEALPIFVSVNDEQITPIVREYIEVHQLRNVSIVGSDHDRAQVFLSGFGARTDRIRDGYCILSAGCMHVFTVKPRKALPDEQFGTSQFVFDGLGFAFLDKSPLTRVLPYETLLRQLMFFRPPGRSRVKDLAIVTGSEEQVVAAECYYNADLKKQYVRQAVHGCMSSIFPVDPQNEIR